MRIAWFSPMPPVRSGIAHDSAELVGALQGDHDIVVFVDEPVVRAAPPGSVRSAHDFVWMHHRDPFHLTVFQLGNSSHHDFMWPYVFRYPGLAVLHDAHLHHARAAALLRERRADHYRAEFAANEPESNRDAAELAVKGFDSFLYYEWHFTRLVTAASKVTAVHSRLVRDAFREQIPDAHVEHIRLGHGTPLDQDAVTTGRRAARTRYRIPDDAIVFGCFGGLAPEKRLPQILDAFGAVLPYAPSARLLLAGAPADHYDVAADVAARALASRIILTGYLDTDEELTECIAASDVGLTLRWPTAREVSGPWLRCLAAGRATVVIDLAHMTDVPSLDPRTWTVNGSDALDSPAPVCVAVDILDEDHSLRLAMRRLAADAGLRDTLGGSARRYWLAKHSHGLMLDDYRRVLAMAADAAAPAPRLPHHLTDDESGLLEHLLGAFAVPVPWSKI
jgi:glycosyltransferase involved in cell wall biosynthesis